jgi:hypothetical protein
VPQYLISVYDQPDSRTRSAQEMAPIIADVTAVNDKARADGIFIFAGGLHEPETGTVIDARSGTPQVTDGPYLETKEYLGGFWVIEVADLDAALEFSRRAAVACRQPLEVRAFMEEPPGA